MKKLFILALILMFAAGTAIAADDEKVSFSGQYRMEMYNMDDQDFNSDADDEEQYIDQRFRVQAVFAPADGVKAVWRADFAETTWGTLEKADTSSATGTTNRGIAYRPAAGYDTIMVDKAYVDLTKAMINARVGLFGHGGLGKGTTTDNQGANIFVTADFAPVQVRALYTKLDEGTSLIDDTDDDANEDEDVYGVDATFTSDAFSAGILYAAKPDAVTDGEANVIGVFGSATFGKVALWGALDYYGGDDGGNTDYVGTDFVLSASMPVTDQLKVALDFAYAPGTTEDDEEQITNLTFDAAYIPLEQGPFAWIEGLGINQWEIEDNAGGMMIAANGTFAVTDEISLFALLGYVTADEEDPDDDGNSVDDIMVYTIAGTYAFMPKTSFSLQYTGVSRSVSGDLEDDPTQKIMGLLKVSF